MFLRPMSVALGSSLSKVPGAEQNSDSQFLAFLPPPELSFHQCQCSLRKSLREKSWLEEELIGDSESKSEEAAITA